MKIEVQISVGDVIGFLDKNGRYRIGKITDIESETTVSVRRLKWYERIWVWLFYDRINIKGKL